MFGAGSANISISRHQRRVMNDCCLSTTTDLLDISPFSIEEAAQQSQLMDCSLPVIEALQSALNDSHNDYSFTTLQAQKSAPIGNSNDWYTDLHLPLIMSDDLSSSSFYKVQRHAVRTDAEKHPFQSKLYNGEEKDSSAPSNDLPQCQLFKNGNVQVHNFESWPTSSQLHHPFVEIKLRIRCATSWLRGIYGGLSKCREVHRNIHKVLLLSSHFEVYA